MATGAGGKYDEICTQNLFDTEAEMVLLIVLRGNRGNGFSVASTSLEAVCSIPGIVRQVADQIEKDTSGPTN